MSRNYIAFDIETAKIIEGPLGDLNSHRPLGITCAATLASSDNEPRTWHGKNADGTPAAQMSSDELSELVRFLVDAQVEMKVYHVLQDVIAGHLTVLGDLTNDQGTGVVLLAPLGDPLQDTLGRLGVCLCSPLTIIHGL